MQDSRQVSVEHQLAIDFTLKCLAELREELQVALSKSQPLQEYDKSDLHDSPLAEKLRRIALLAEGQEVDLNQVRQDVIDALRFLDLLVPDHQRVLEPVITQARLRLISAMDLLTITEAAEVFGVQRPAMYTYIHSGMLHPLHIRGHPRLERQEIERLKVRTTEILGKRKEGQSMTQMEEILRAVEVLIRSGHDPFTREEIREELGIDDQRVWDSYSATFQMMRLESQDKNVSPRYRDVFRLAEGSNRRFHTLTARGRQLLGQLVH